MKAIPESIRPRLVARFCQDQFPRAYQKQAIEVTPEEFNELQCGSSMMSLNEQRVTATLHSKTQEWRQIGSPARHTATFSFFDIIE
jgi:hypothetical protein